MTTEAQRERRRRARQRKAQRNRQVASLKKRAPRAQPKHRAQPQRNKTVIRGRGDYNQTKQQIKTAANTAARSAGSLAGEYAMDALLGLCGLGEYRHPKIKRNSLMKGPPVDFGGQGPPAVMNDGNGTVVVNHRELAGEVFVGTDGTFHYQKLGINPANQSLFPWLAKVSQNFQQWRLQGCVVQLKSMASNYTANVSLGTIFAGIQYNYYAPDPNSMRELANLDGACTVKSSKDIIMPIECAPRMTTMTDLYVDNPGVIKDGDQRFNYMGNIYVGYEGVKQTAAEPVDDLVLFQIWISYEVALLKPILTEDTGVFDTLKLNSPNVTLTVPAVGDPSLNWGTIVQQIGAQSEIEWGYKSPEDTTILRFTLPSYEANYIVALAYCKISDTGATAGEICFGITPNAYCGFRFEMPGVGGVNTVEELQVPRNTFLVPVGDSVSTLAIIRVPSDPLDDNVPYFDVYLDVDPAVTAVMVGSFTIIISQVDPNL